MPLVLIGPRGCGKSTVGRRLAREWDTPFIDLDERIEHSAGRRIAEIFAAEGESGFRAREAAALSRALDQRRSVIATGGGVVVLETNRRLLVERAPVRVLLECDAETLFRRVSEDPASAATRPPLTPAGGGLEEMREILARRTPLYLALATHVVRAEGKPEEVAAGVMRALTEEHDAASGG